MSDPTSIYDAPATVSTIHDRALRWGRWTQYLLAVHFVAVALGIVSEVARLMDEDQAFGALTDAYLEREALIDTAWLAVYFVTAVVFGRFIYVAKKDLRELRVTDLQFSPGWSVGWFFVPLANLWMPYKAMAESFRASDPTCLDRRAWKGCRVPGIVKAWWAAWITSNLVGRFSASIWDSAASPEEYLLAGQVDVAAGMIDVLLTVLAIMLVGALVERRQAKAVAVLEARAAERH